MRKIFQLLLTKPKKKILLSLVISSFFLTLKGSPNIIEGRIVNSKTQQPVEYATVSAISETDSTQVKSGITDTLGNFEIKDLTEGKYIIRVMSIGFHPTKKGNISISANTPRYNAGNIELKEDLEQLNEVTVVGERLKGSVEVDKTVYTITNMAASSATSGLELLRQIPAVNVDFRKTITLEGSNNILVYVDGQRRDNEYLDQMDPNTIDKIEIITNPSVKYEADVSGVINVITKKNKAIGINGRIDFNNSVTDKPQHYGRMNIECGFKKARIYSSASYYYEDYKYYNSNYRESNENKINSVLDQNAKGNSIWKNYGITVGADWFINDKNTININVYHMPYQAETRKTSEEKFNKENNILTDIINTAAKTQDNQYKSNITLFYRRTFNKPDQELTSELTYLPYRRDLTVDYEENYYAPDTFLILRNEFTDIGRQDIRYNIDYIQPISKDFKLGLGYNNSAQTLDNSFTRTLKNNFTDTTDIFEYSELRQAAYSSFSGKIKDFSWQVGLRFEYSFIDISSSNSKIEYSCFLPNASLKLKISENQTLKINFRNYIQRPAIRNLNPFINRIDSFSIVRGNPKLTPSVRYKIEANYSIQQGNNFFTPGFFYDFYNNSYQEITILNNGLSETFMDNVLSGYETGVNFSGSFTITKWWQMSAFFQVFQVKIKENKTFNIPEDDLITWRSNASIIITLPKDFAISGNIYYSGPGISSQTLYKSYPFSSLSLEKKLFKNKQGKVSLNLLNPFQSYYYAIDSEQKMDNYYQHRTVRYNFANVCILRFSYNFKKGENIKQAKFNGNSENEGNDIGIGGR